VTSDEWLLKESSHIKIINVATTETMGHLVGTVRGQEVLHGHLAANENKKRRQVAYERFWAWVVLALLARPFF
jgi:hypothetical protein